MWNHLDLGDDDNEEEAAWRTSWQEDSHWMLKLTDEELLETDDDELSEEEAVCSFATTDIEFDFYLNLYTQD
jgi:hypothetical protein